MLTSYGVGKILGGQFYRKGNIPEAIAQTKLLDVTGFDLAWTFFGYSEAYVFFIGVSQIIGSVLLLFNRTKLLGALVLVPVLLNIIMVDLTFQISWGALMSACIYLSSLLVVLWLNKRRILKALQVLTGEGRVIGMRRKWMPWAVAMIAVAVLITVENTLLNWVGR
ncbi:MAG: hypothetical protein CL605_06540 [Altibacter sp.]|nr:hypothetical protein [Altibacter sp.]